MLCNAANGFSSLFFAARQAKETRLGGKRVGFLLRFNKQQLKVDNENVDDDDDDDDNEEEEEEEDAFIFTRLVVDVMVIISRPTDRPTNIKRSFVVDKKSAAVFICFFLPLVFFAPQKEAKKHENFVLLPHSGKQSFCCPFRRGASEC